jgi:hypothetical protein
VIFIERGEIENNVIAVTDNCCIDSLPESGYMMHTFTGL